MERESKLVKFFKVLGSILFGISIFICFTIFIFNRVYEYHTVYGPSMAPTLNAVTNEDDGIYIRKNAPTEIGDMIVAKNPNTSKYVIKRLIGLSGDRIAIEKSFANSSMVFKIWIIKAGATSPRLFKFLGENYITEPYLYNDFYTSSLSKKTFESINGLNYLVIPEGYMFFIGDNQTSSEISSDCADYGAIAYSNYIGKVEFIIHGRKHFISQIINQFYDKMTK